MSGKDALFLCLKVVIEISPLYDLLRANGSIVINKNFIHGIGLNEAIIYSELLSKFDYFETRNQLQYDKAFFNTVDDLYLSTGIADRAQRTAIKNLVRLGLLANTTKGIPPKRYFKLCFDDKVINYYLRLGADKIAMKKEDLKEKNTVSLDKLYIVANASIESCDSKYCGLR